ncbi:UDP-N-acetylglucosamine 2-epimerase (non-hydrolyzing) [Heliobacterium undosum]|uniref:UDP-N-acetylglucosamine 2-epimerase (Non-hydrolyzing) n=1 Tax=Heliomicrobium undosum TaxID=121734 RepID=A0A845L3C0_9FIRM|nr:UDP-N-acetylglucosamine 2-epimerase (non-hydrolyzing) [Heliomicrobium undosum]MZP29515.1 UDP-N-acetylglucosamine 2-epimerase (non-hydrolyzing) [Heliomicrobium undosum]
MKIVTIVGARPQFIKAAAVSRAIERRNEIKPETRLREVLVHTGQHYDQNMSDVFFKELSIPKPDYHLGIGSGPQGKQTGRMLETVEEVLQQEKPDWVLVYGDTNSTLAGALAAAKLHIPVAHVEAGLRSFNRRMPEEVNRVLTDHVSSLLFCPTAVSVKNLLAEGIREGVIDIGDVMYDCLLYYRQRIDPSLATLRSLEILPEQYVLATVHRAENADSAERLSAIFSAFGEIGQRLPVLLAVHPRTRQYIQKYGIVVPLNVRLIEPLSYMQMIEMEANARVIVTDSGGVQKEAYFMGVPCLTVRDETEWVETVESGANVLCGAQQERICAEFQACMDREKQQIPVVGFGDGQAAQRIVEALEENRVGGNGIGFEG